MVELDGRVAHPGDSRWNDIHRDNAATTAGISTLRYGWLEVTERLARWPPRSRRRWRDAGTTLARPCSPTCPVGRATAGAAEAGRSRGTHEPREPASVGGHENVSRAFGPVPARGAARRRSASAASGARRVSRWCQATAEVSVSDAIWSMTTRSRARSSCADSNSGRNIRSSVTGAPASTASASSAITSRSRAWAAATPVRSSRNAR